MLENDNSKMSKQNQEKENQLQVNQNEIYNLMARVQSLESNNTACNNTILKIQDDNLQIKRENGMLKDEIESLMLQFRNEREKCMLQGNHITTLQQMIEKQKKKNVYL